MEHHFWHERWQANQLGFHEGRPNAMLVAHLGALALAPGARIFLPLCGKTRDIAWLRDQGFQLAGAELSEIAIRDLFADLGETPKIAPAGTLTHYAVPGVDMFVGDIFGLDADVLGAVDAIYDRAALVALPDEMRAAYVRHLPPLTGQAPQLLITFDYDQSVMAGPPFSVPETEVARLYRDSYTLTRLAAAPVEGKLKGTAAADEIALLLR